MASSNGTVISLNQSFHWEQPENQKKIFFKICLKILSNYQGSKKLWIQDSEKRKTQKLSLTFDAIFHLWNLLFHSAAEKLRS